MEELKKEFATDLFNTITSNGCREMTEARFNEALKEYKQSILTLVDEMSKAIEEYPFNEYNAGYKCALNELKQKIEAL